MKTIKFKQWVCKAEFLTYPNGATAILLVEKEVDPMDTSPIAKATVNIVKEHYHPDDHKKIKFSEDLPNNQCYIKTWSENEGILEALIEAGVVELEGSGIDINGQGCVAILVEILE